MLGMWGKTSGILGEAFAAVRADLRFAAVAFGAALAGCLAVAGLVEARLPLQWLWGGFIVAVGAGALLPRKTRNRAWRTLRWFASRRLEHVRASLWTAEIIRAPKVIDGDTIDDQASGIRYRLAGIDAPETGDRASCYSERKHGDLSKAAAIDIVRGAKLLEARRTGRTDVYGRAVAYLYVDGVELGDILVGRGLARPWRGGRKPWCGRRGGMLKMARHANVAWDCSKCRQRFSPNKPNDP
ncbi:MAG: thermonuclease family protein [Hyphomonadaceae bacterium]